VANDGFNNLIWTHDEAAKSFDGTPAADAQTIRERRGYLESRLASRDHQTISDIAEQSNAETIRIYGDRLMSNQTSLINRGWCYPRKELAASSIQIWPSTYTSVGIVPEHCGLEE
jgi:hypothetical protein